jgi:hypothetical protein
MSSCHMETVATQRKYAKADDMVPRQ